MVHVFNYKDKHYLYDSGSGSLHVCDADTAAYVKAKYENSVRPPMLSAEKITEIESDLASLKEQGLFCAMKSKLIP